MNCLFCNDKIIDITETIELSSPGIMDLSSCQFTFYVDVFFMALYTCVNKKIAIFEKDYLGDIERFYPSFKKEYDCIEYNCEDHDDIETIDGRIIEVGFVF